MQWIAIAIAFCWLTVKQQSSRTPLEACILSWRLLHLESYTARKARRVEHAGQDGPESRFSLLA